MELLSHAYSCKGEICLFPFNEFPRCFLSKCFTRPIPWHRAVFCLSFCDWIPVFFRIDISWTTSFRSIHYGRERTCYDLKKCLVLNNLTKEDTHNSFHSGGAFVDGFEQSCCPDHGRVQKVLFGVCYIKMIGGWRVNNSLKRRVRFHRLVKSPLNGDVFNNEKIQPFLVNIWMRILDGFRFSFGPYGCDYGVPMFEQNIEDMSRDETATAYV